MQTYLIKLHDPISTDGVAVGDRGNHRINHILKGIDVEPASMPILSRKSKFVPVMIKSVKTSWANIIKQEMLASGGDAAISRWSYNCSQEYSDVLLLGTEACLLRFLDKMKAQPACFKQLESEIRSLLYPANDAGKLLVGKKTFDLNKELLILGILNVTPDSFSDGGRYNNYDDAMRRAEELLKDGANLIDIGGESTRPGSVQISEQEELERVMPVVESVVKNFGDIVSIDSYKPEVISSAIDSGAVMVNDISSGNGIKEVVEKIAKSSVSIISMMNSSCGSYKGSTSASDIISPLEKFMDFCRDKRLFLSKKVLIPNRLIFDPGLGFGLSVDDTSRLIKNIYSATSKNIPVCIGLIRKSYIGRITGLETGERDPIGQAISLFLIGQGVRIFRTHEPKALKDVMNFHEAIEGIN
jgi:dihydropteroate synthase